MAVNPGIIQVPNKLLEHDHYWYNPSQVISPDFFAQLCKDFPSLDHFEWHDGYQRKHGQRPHNRFYLAYEESLHHLEPYSGKGLIKHHSLPESWQLFMHELETNKEYRDFMRDFLKVKDFITRYEWHVGGTGCEVSPHLDADAKIGKHIFYFNTAEDWDENWGGQTVLLEGKRVDNMRPDFEDFENAIETKILNNHSFLLRNGPTSWHGVKPLTCPNNKYRKILNVVWEYPDAGLNGMEYRANYT